MNTVATSLAALLVQPPKFEHDCTACEYLGRHVAEDGFEYDLYVHPGQGVNQTVIARFSSEGRDYISGMPSSYGSSEMLTEARLRAQARGSLKYDVVEALSYAVKGTPYYAEMLRALVGSAEGKALAAFKRGDHALANTFVRTAFAEGRARYPKSNRTHAERIDNLESLLRRVAEALYERSSFARGTDYSLMVDFLCGEEHQPSTLEPL